MAHEQGDAAPLALRFSEFCRQIGISYQTGCRVLAKCPAQLPATQVAAAQLPAMCERLLANTVIEGYRLELG